MMTSSTDDATTYARSEIPAVSTCGRLRVSLTRTPVDSVHGFPSPREDLAEAITQLAE